jgi:2,3-diketo-5-methylthio-1-phosphopentane phosphatase
MSSHHPRSGAFAKPSNEGARYPRPVNGRTLVVDYDGTITEQDVLDEIAQLFGDPDVYAEVDAGLDDRDLPLNEVLRREFEPVTAPLEDVVDWVLANARVRSGFRELVELARERGWRFVVVSSGFHELIRPVLERAGLPDLEIMANTIVPDPAGWRIEFEERALCDTCGEPCKRALSAGLADGGELVYIGDGYSDRCAAEHADRVFARRGLATYLAERGVAFEPFEDFHEVIRHLA